MQLCKLDALMHALLKTDYVNKMHCYLLNTSHIQNHGLLLLGANPHVRLSCALHLAAAGLMLSWLAGLLLGLEPLLRL